MGSKDKNVKFLFFFFDYSHVLENSVAGRAIIYSYRPLDDASHNNPHILFFSSLAPDRP